MIGRVLANRYKVVAAIGEGGMSQVWRAQDQNTGKLVAVKVLREEFREDETFVRRFEREAQAASRMTHPNIANLLDVGVEEDGTRYLVIEYVSGKTLKQFIQESGALRPETAAQIIIRVLAAVQHAHQNGVIHRDIKPQNILIDKEGTVKVSDFGIARVANSQTMNQESDVVMGSVYYFSPEQAKGAVVDEKSDLYSAGVVLYEMLTGHVPFAGDTPVAIAMKHLNETPRPPSEHNSAVSAALDYVVLRAMAKRPRSRYAAAADMLKDVRLALEHPDTILAAREEVERQEREQRAEHRRRQHAEKHMRRIRQALVIVFAVILLGLTALAGYIITDQVMRARRNTIEVPNFIGMPKKQAMDMAIELGMDLALRTDVYPLAPEDVVIDQSIPPGSFVAPGETITIVICQSTYDLTIPNVVGMPVDIAQKMLDERGLVVEENNYVISAALPDTVVAQEPAPGQPANRGDSVVLIISGGAVTMPVLKGLTLAQAEQAILASNLVLRSVSEQEVDDPSMIGVVVDQVPAIYESVRPKTTVEITMGVSSSSMRVAEVIISLASMDEGETIMVTVDEEDGTQSRQFLGAIPEDRVDMTVTLYSKTARRSNYHVYIDDVLQISKPVVFTPR